MSDKSPDLKDQINGLLCVCQNLLNQIGELRASIPADTTDWKAEADRLRGIIVHMAKVYDCETWAANQLKSIDTKLGE